MDISTIGLIGTGIMVAFLAIGFLLGLWRGLFKSALRVVTLIISIVISFVLINTVFSSVIEMVGKEITKSIAGGSEMADLMASGTVAELIEAFVFAIAAPIVFMVLYFIINKLMLIIYGIAKLFIRPLVRLEKAKIPFRRLLGGAVGMVGAMISLSVLMTPIGGYATLVDNVFTTIEQAEEGTYPEELKDGVKEIKPYTDEIVGSVGVKVPYMLGGQLMFNSLTSFKVEAAGETVSTSLGEEAEGILALIPRATALSEMSFTDLETFDITPLSDLIAALDAPEANSKIVKILIADVCSTAATKWRAGETFLSINMDELLSEDAAAFRPSVDLVLEDLAETTPSTVSADLMVFVDTINGVKETYVYIMKVTDVNTELTKDDVKNLIKNLTPETVELVRASVDGVLAETELANEEGAQAIAGVLMDTLEGLANTDMTEEELDREADAINFVLTAATTDAIQNGDVNADDMVGAVMSSTIMAGALTNAAQEGNASDFGANEETSETVNAALDNFAANNQMTAEQQAAADALRAMFATAGN